VAASSSSQQSAAGLTVGAAAVVEQAATGSSRRGRCCCSGLFDPTHVARWLRMPTIVVRDRGGACGAAGWAQRGRVPTHDHGHERAERQSVHDALNDSVPSQRKVSLWWRKRGGCGLLFGVPPRPCVTGCSYGSHGGPRVRQTCFGRWIALARGHARAAPRAGHWRFPRSPVAKTWPRYLRDPALESRRAPPTGRRAVVARVGEAPSAAPCLLSLRRVCPSTREKQPAAADRAVRKLRGNGYIII
jgi:hypothetical protein